MLPVLEQAAVGLTGLPSTKSVMMVPLAHAPLKVGVVSLVMLSVFEAPESVLSVMSGALSAAGAVVSMVKVRLLLRALLLPAASVACTRAACEASATADGVMV